MFATDVQLSVKSVGVTIVLDVKFAFARSQTTELI